eukprot:scaffold9273_cov128-Isochrysis_galbana.AAC.1
MYEPDSDGDEEERFHACQSKDYYHHWAFVRQAEAPPPPPPSVPAPGAKPKKKSKAEAAQQAIDAALQAIRERMKTNGPNPNLPVSLAKSKRAATEASAAAREAAAQ